ncbi:conserved oligomeric Golgi complex subunit 3 [Paragonimus westermani]|uniref:Conserved oligomeric Golgi complex subunit 3 n=1 Tax=Paragonimus westermani TaxID=34504 RepID=A0A5J4NS24_9TREM|nr:conserved oligomeric Golgi complex subunit 3 [Paragonimus westermani]
MSVINWDRADTCEAPLSEKQSEAIFHLSTLDYRTTPTNIVAPSESLSSHDVPDNQSFTDTVHLQLASHFYSWLGKVEQHVDAKEEKGDIDFLHYVGQKRQHCTRMLVDLTDILKSLSTLKDNYSQVSDKTNSLHEACEHLLQQQGQLSESVVKMEDTLTNFANVDIVEAELRSIHSVISKDKMKPIFARLDTSMRFFREHDVVSPDNSFILLYGRFRSQGPKIRSMISLIEERINNSSEYAQALQDCHKFYIERREELLTPVARSGIAELVDKYPNDHCALLRTGGAFLVHMCEDETRLFGQFFDPQLSASLNFSLSLPYSKMLSNLCRCFYDAFRPQIIHINHIEILSELCDIFQYELAEEHLSDSEIDMTAFGELCSMLLADVQERLIFRAHVYIKSQILGYEPSPGDLSYPEKLVMMNNIAKLSMKSPSVSSPTDSDSVPVAKLEESDGVAVQSASGSIEPDLSVQPGPNMSLSPADLHGMWYPTVRRTLVCLSKLSRCLDTDSFRGLAQECVSICVQSLVKASDAIAIRRTPADGQLFLIKHLLILREQMTPFNVDFSVKETSLDFSNYKNTALGIWTQRGSGLFALNRNNLLLRFLLEIPNVVEVEVDSRRQLDGQLKQTCQTFINQTVARLSGELPQFLNKAMAVLAAPGARLTDQPFATPANVRQIVSNAHRALTSALGRGSRGGTRSSSRELGNEVSELSIHLIECLNTYLANPDTEGILLRHIQTGVLQHWRALYQLLADQYSNEERMIIACPTESQVDCTTVYSPYKYFISPAVLCGQYVVGISGHCTKLFLLRVWFCV